MYNFICKHCGKPFQSHHKDGKFCSWSCSVTWRNLFGDLQKPKVYSTCLLCGERFRTELNKIRRGIARYCSRSCYNKARKIGMAKRLKFFLSKEELGKLYLDEKLSYKQIAKKTGVAYTTIEKWVKRFGFPRRDISTATKLAMRKFVKRVPVKCNYCGKILYRWPKFVSLHKYSFCSRRCFDLGWRGKNNPAWRGGHQPNYGPNWKKQKRKALERDNYICQICDAQNNGKRLDVHHIVSFRDFGLEKYEEANRLENLVTLCHSHHMDIENHPDKYENSFNR